MISTFFSFIIPVLIGYLMLNQVINKNEFEDLLLKIILGSGLGLGLSSIFFFLNLVLTNGYKCILYGLESGLLVSLLFINIKNNGFKKIELNIDKSRLWTVFLTVNIIAICLFILSFINQPLGSWDGWHLWNTKAAFLTGENWQNVFNIASPLAHNDYPLLIPAICAKMNNNGINPFNSAFIAMFFTFLTPWLLYNTLTMLKNQRAGLIAGSILFGTQPFIIQGAMQCADIPLAFYITATISTMLLADKLKNNKLLAIAGFFSGLCMWTKNEGLIFTLILAILLLIQNIKIKDFNPILNYFLGFISLFVFIIFFKLNYAKNNDMLPFLSFNHIRECFFDISRYTSVIKHFIYNIFFLPAIYPGFGLLLYWGKEKIQNKFNYISILTIVLLLISYCGIYLITPHDIEWQLKTSMLRLMLHITPATLLLLLLNTKVEAE